MVSLGTFNAIAPIIAGVFIIYLGYLIGVKKMLFFIIGFNDSTFYGDKDKFARRIGLSVLILGAILLVMPLFVLFFGEDAVKLFKYIIGIYVLIMLVIANSWRFRF